MGDFDIDAMRRDQEAGTKEPWHYVAYRSADGSELLAHAVEAGNREILWADADEWPEDQADMRRIARVPDMEAEIERLTARVAELEASLVKAGQVASEIARIAKGLTKAQARALEDLGGHRWARSDLRPSTRKALLGLGLIGYCHLDPWLSRTPLGRLVAAKLPKERDNA